MHCLLGCCAELLQTFNLTNWLLLDCLLAVVDVATPVQLIMLLNHVAKRAQVYISKNGAELQRISL